MIPLREPLCLHCRRFVRDSENPPRCGAFPAGIPEEIFDGEVSHLDSLNGEPAFLGSIPVGWETQRLEPDYDDSEPDWSPAKEGEKHGEVRVVRD